MIWRYKDITFKRIFAWYPVRITRRYSGPWPGKYRWVWLATVVQSFCRFRGHWYAYEDAQHLKDSDG